MIKILHSADWHLDSPLLFRTSEQTFLLRNALQHTPSKIAEICQTELCDMVLLPGDLLDRSCTTDTLDNLRNALEEMAVPVFITPGNHDYIGANSPWTTAHWPGNVHIFIHPAIESVSLPELDCRVYGAGFHGMDCPSLLDNFKIQQTERYAVGVFHGDPTQVNSPYCPITAQQVALSGLDYLALGHIHKQGSFRSGKTLCAWPGCPMGRGYDEQGEKGVLIVTIGEDTATRFVPLDTPRFYDLEIPATQSLSSVLPPVGSKDFYRITFTGPSEPLDLDSINAQFTTQFPNLELRDKTSVPVDPWSSVGEDSLEGLFFQRLRDALKDCDEDRRRQISLAAQISRQLLDGQEVVLP